MSLSLRPSLLALGAGLALLLGIQPGRAAAQAPVKPKPVQFTTVDQVELQGKFYEGAKKTEVPCILLVTDIGGNINEKGWADLAKDLQAKGYPVLAFDFRGHGDSTRVDNTIFWTFAQNKALIKSGRLSKPPESITWRDFQAGYYPYLVNDIAAAKVYLDTLNKKGDVNSANVVLISARGGAELCALYINEEMHRYRVAGGAGQTDPKPEGKDIYACVWLSMNGSVGTKSILHSLMRPTAMLRVCKEKEDFKIPMYFLYGEKDLESRNIASTVVTLLQPKKGKGKVEVGKKAISGSGTAKGRELLAKDLGTITLIGKYLDQVTQNKTLNAYDQDKSRDFKAAAYVWKLGLRPTLAKQPSEASLVYIQASYFSGAGR